MAALRMAMTLVFDEQHWEQALKGARDRYGLDVSVKSIEVRSQV